MMALPSDDILLKYASGALDPALRLLLDRHFALNPVSRERVAALEQFGGLMLTAETPASLTAGSLDRALARIAAAPLQSAPEPVWPPLQTLRWRWAGHGRKIANVDIAGSSMKSYALKIAPGKEMLQHSHAAQEWTLIVQGSYRDETGDFYTGSFIEEDDRTVHTPFAIGDVDCICLAVISGPLTVPGLKGRVAQWLMR